MTTAQQREQDRNKERGDQQRRHAVIRGQVIRTLGTPGDLLDVQVRPLWDETYRVNVLVGGDATSTRVAHSYFLVADGEGKILACTPAITKRY
jgi:hypothetical protein